jgi:hypothetical protein
MEHPLIVVNGTKGVCPKAMPSRRLHGSFVPFAIIDGCSRDKLMPIHLSSAGGDEEERLTLAEPGLSGSFLTCLQEIGSDGTETSAVTICQT